MKELFPISQTKMLSPRLAWCKKHGIKTGERKRSPKPEERWMAWATAVKFTHGFGPTEEDACRDWGVRTNTPLWNEVP